MELRLAKLFFSTKYNSYFLIIINSILIKSFLLPCIVMILQNNIPFIKNFNIAVELEFLG